MATQPLVTTTTQGQSLAINSEEGFALRQRQARMFSMSLLVPEHLRKGTPEQAMANCYIALALAEAMGEMPLIVMQNIHVINGKAGFAAKYMIARANASGKFADDLDWEETGSGETLSLFCFATLAKSGKRVGMKADMKMAKAEGWTNNKKYQTMPEVMLRYRSASFLVNMYAPEVMLGYRTTDEIEDLIAAGAPLSEPLTAKMLTNQATGEDVVDEVTGEVIGEVVDTETGEIIQEGPADTDRGELFASEDDLPEIAQAAASIKDQFATTPDKAGFQIALTMWNRRQDEITAYDASLAVDLNNAKLMAEQRLGVA